MGSVLIDDGRGNMPCPVPVALSFSRTDISRVPSSPGLFQFSASRHSGWLNGYPVPHILSHEHSTRVILPVLSRIVFNFGF